MFTYFIDGVRTAIAVCRCFRGTPWCANWFYKRWNSTGFQRSSGRNFKLNTSTSRLTETAHSFRAPTVHKIVIGASLTSSSSLLQITLQFCFSINLSKASLCEVKSTRDSGQEIWNSQNRFISLQKSFETFSLHNKLLQSWMEINGNGMNILKSTSHLLHANDSVGCVEGEALHLSLWAIERSRQIDFSEEKRLSRNRMLMLKGWLWPTWRRR